MSTPFKIKENGSYKKCFKIVWSEIQYSIGKIMEKSIFEKPNFFLIT